MRYGGNEPPVLCLQTNAAYLLFYHRQDKIRHPAPSPAPSADITSCGSQEAEQGGAACVTMETD